MCFYKLQFGVSIVSGLSFIVLRTLSGNDFLASPFLYFPYGLALEGPPLLTGALSDDSPSCEDR